MEKVTVRIEVELGNASMKDGDDARAVIMGKIPQIMNAIKEEKSDGGRFMDDNGNTVGNWTVQAE